MESGRISFRILFLVALFLAPSLPLALAASWEEMSDGNHSFQSLGTDFYVPVPMKRAEGARLILFNYELAARLGLEVPQDPGKLEKMVLAKFGYVVAKPEEQASRSFMATRYLDSNKKAPGEALGDGRAVWIGEIREDARTAWKRKYRAQRIGKGRALVDTHDVVLKGVGVTPLAWTNHADPAHKDGLQSMEEAVHSFIHSEANIRNGIDSTGDLAVIELPEIRDVPGKPKNNAAITVRVGEQTRLSHLRYFDDEPENFRKIFDYVVRRDLGLPPDAKVTRGAVKDYLESFAVNLAEDAAHYYDLHAVHGSPTLGNRTSGGGTIDLGTFRYLDAHHVEYNYLNGTMKLGGEAGQTAQLRWYISYIFQMMERGRYPLGLSEKKKTELLLATKKAFRTTFENRQAELALERLGLSSEEVRALSPELRARFGRATRNLYEATGEKLYGAGKGARLPAAFDMRGVFLGTAKLLHLPDAERRAHWNEVFENDRAWASLRPGQRKRLKAEFRRAVEKIWAELSPGTERKLAWQAAALAKNGKDRIAPGASFYYGDEKFAVAKEVLDAVANKEDFAAITKKAMIAADGLVDAVAEEVVPSRTCEDAYRKLPLLRALHAEFPRAP